MVVSTKEAKAAATDTCQKELGEIEVKLRGIEDREEKSKLLHKLKQEAHPETQNFLALTQRREEEHSEFMREIMPLMEEFKDVMSDRKTHDFSKDGLFFFAAPSYFDGRCQTPEMKELVDSELKRHYTLEPHHPEYELYNEGECEEIDIVEMAVDRLARNVQFGNGIVNMEVMKKFMPKFTKGDNDKKREIFWRNCEKYEKFVMEKFFEKYPEAREWSK